jgi:hypothetical protein
LHDRCAVLPLTDGYSTYLVEVFLQPARSIAPRASIYSGTPQARRA